MQVEKLIKNLKEDQSKALCFFGFNDGRKRAERLYICYESNINLYSHLLYYEPLFGRLVKSGEASWDSLKEALESRHKHNYEKRWNTVRLIHGEYPACGFDTDHGAQVCGFDSLEKLMWDISACDRGEIGHCTLANPKSPTYEHHAILTKEQMFKDAIYFSRNRKEWKFLFDWGDDVDEKCNQYVPEAYKEPKPKDQRYHDLKKMKILIEDLLRLDPENEYKEKLPKVIEELEGYEE